MIECFNFKEMNKGSLLGFGDIYISKTDDEIYGIALYKKGESYWVTLPSREYEKMGEKKYWPYIKKRNKDIQMQYLEHIKNAVLKKREEVLKEKENTDEELF